MLNNKSKNIIFYVTFAVVFFILTLWFSAIPIKNIAHVLPSGGDPLLVTYIWSWEMHQIPINPLELFNANIFAPFKNTLAFSEHMLGSLLLAWPLFLIFKNIVLVFNLVSLGSFAISGLGMYLLANYLTKNKLASLVAAFIYAFAPFKIEHLEHINLSGMWLPYFFLCLERFFESQTWRNVLLLTLFISLVFLNAMQYFLFLPIIIVIFLIKHILCKTFKIAKDNVYKILTSAIILAVIIIPLSIPYLNFKKDFDFQRDLRTIEGLSPDLFDYFINPAIYKFYYYPSAFLQERIVGPGIFVIILLIISIYLIYKKSININKLLVYFLTGFLAVLFSFGYYIQLTTADFGGMIGTWAFFYNYIPGFSGIRAPGRLSIFFLISSCLFIATAVAYLLNNKIKKKYYRYLFIFAAVLFLFIEFSVISFKKYMPIPSKHALVYDWVKEQKDANIYLEMPLGINYLEQDYDKLYEFASINHFKKTVNGYSGYAPKEYEQLNNELTHFDMSDIQPIKDYGATDIIFHFDFYSENFKKTTLEKLSKENSVELIYNIDNDYVFQIK